MSAGGGGREPLPLETSIHKHPFTRIHFVGPEPYYTMSPDLLGDKGQADGRP
jgi:hypothetical protein